MELRQRNRAYEQYVRRNYRDYKQRFPDQPHETILQRLLVDFNALTEEQKNQYRLMVNTSDFCPAQGQMGSGSYGIVYGDRDYPDRIVKVLGEMDISDDEVPTNYQVNTAGLIEATAELEILFSFNDPGLVRGTELYERGFCGRGYSIEMERLTGNIVDELNEYNVHSLNLSNDEKFGLLCAAYKDYATGFMDLHASGFLHLDIAERNLMFQNIDGGSRFVIIDFGAAIRVEFDAQRRIIPVRATMTKISFVERPPELYSENGTYSDKTDVWCLGMCMLSTFRGRSYYSDRDIELEWERLARENKTIPFSTYLQGEKMMSSDEEFMRYFIKGLTQPLFVENYVRSSLFEVVPENKKPEFIDLLCRIFRENPEDRCTMEDVANHAFFGTAVVVPRPRFMARVAPYDINVIYSDRLVDYYNGVASIVGICERYFPRMPLEMLFSSVHLFLKTITKDSLVGIPREEILDVAAVCVTIVFRLYENIHLLPPVFANADLVMWDYEFPVFRESHCYLSEQVIKPYSLTTSQASNVMYNIGFPVNNYRPGFFSKPPEVFFREYLTVSVNGTQGFENDKRMVRGFKEHKGVYSNIGPFMSYYRSKFGIQK
jgi:serine/threonine protein kinase